MSLPPGLALNPLTGQISGTPTTPGTYNFTLRVRDSQGSQRDVPSAITIVAYSPPVLSGTLAGFANRTQPYSSALSVAGGTSPYTWSIASGALPTGITISASTGLISGTPSDTTYTDRTVTVRVVDSQGSAAQSTQTIRYADLLALTGSLTSGVQAVAYSDGFVRSGGHSPFTFAIISGSLPTGLSFNTTTGMITGTAPGTSSNALTIRVTDASGATAERSGTLTINSAYAPVDITGSVTNNSQNVEVLSSFSITPTYSGVSVTGGNATITYSWARISGSTAISAGSPNSLATSFVGNVSPGASVSAAFRLTATDGTSSDTLDVTVTVTNTYVTMSLSSGSTLATRTVAYGNTLSRTGGKSPFTFAVIGGTLPTGIALATSTGVVSGTPTDTSYTTRNMTFRVTDALGATADASASIIYANFPTMSYPLGAAMRTREYARSPTQGGGHLPGSYALVSGTLPTGITLNTTTGTVSGTPSDTSYTTRSPSIRYTDAAGNQVAFNGTLPYADNLSISGTLPGSATNGVAYSSSALSASGGYAPVTWSISVGSLPTGLSINSSTGAVTGTPSVGGTFNFTVTVTDAQGFLANSAQTIAVSAALAISGSYSPNAMVTRAYSSGGVTASGGTAPYTYSVFSGSLPSGLSLNSSTGAITGTPTLQGTASFVIRVTDNLGATANTGSLSIIVAANLTLTGTTSAVAMRTRTYSSTNLAVSGGTAPYTLSVASGSLPAGVFINTLVTGNINGTPTVVGTASFIVRATDANGFTADSGAQSIVVAENLAAAGTVSSVAMATRAYSSSAITSAGGTAPISWSVSSGALPTGITINASTGVVSGTPTDVGTFNFVARATDTNGFTADSASQSLVVSANLAIAGTFPAGTVSASYSSTALSASGGNTPYAWAISAGALPPGLTLNSSTGALTGTPTTASSYSFTVRATDANGFQATSAQSVTIASGVSVSVNDNNAIGFLFSPAPAPTSEFITSFPSTVMTASGGTPPYTYSWARISGATQISADSPSANSTTFSANVPQNTQYFAVFRGTVTDSTGASATVNVNVTLDYAVE